MGAKKGLIMWNLLTEEEKIYFIRGFSGSNAEEITLEVVHSCELRLSEKQRAHYVDYISGEIAAITYQRVDPSSEMATNLYYFNMLNMSADLKAKMIWHAVNGVQP